MKKKTLIATTVALLSVSATSMAQMTYEEAVRSSAAYYTAIDAASVPTEAVALTPEESKVVSGNKSEDWKLKVWTVVTSGGCCGTVARTYYGKFDSKTGKFLGYIDNDIRYSTSETPDWK